MLFLLMLLLLLLLLFIIILNDNVCNTIISGFAQEDNCASYDALPELYSLNERTINYVRGDGEQPICDNFLIEQWYSMDNFVLTHSTASCGTWINWYLSSKSM